MAVPATMTLLPVKLFKDVAVGDKLLTYLPVQRHRPSWGLLHRQLQYPFLENGYEVQQLWEHNVREIFAPRDLPKTYDPNLLLACTRNEPGYTVITRSMSAALPISSVIAEAGVSGEIATPALIFLP